jgi:hypothetical protein
MMNHDDAVRKRAAKAKTVTMASFMQTPEATAASIGAEGCCGGGAQWLVAEVCC